MWHPLISISLAMFGNSCQDVNSQTRTLFFRRSAKFWWALRKQPWKASFTTGWRDCANVTQPVESTWSRETFYINRMTDETAGPEMLTLRWDTFNKISMLISAGRGQASFHMRARAITRGIVQQDVDEIKALQIISSAK
jgi:hypothetical protein